MPPVVQVGQETVKEVPPTSAPAVPDVERGEEKDIDEVATCPRVFMPVENGSSPVTKLVLVESPPNVIFGVAPPEEKIGNVPVTAVTVPEPDPTQVPLIAKQPPERFIPFDPVEVAAKFNPVVKLGVEEAIYAPVVVLTRKYPEEGADGTVILTANTRKGGRRSAIVPHKTPSPREDWRSCLIEMIGLFIGLSIVLIVDKK